MIFARDDSDRASVREVRGLAMRTGRLDIVRAVDRSLRHSRRLQLSLQLTKQLLRANQSEVAKTTRLANRAPTAEETAEEFDSLTWPQAWSGSLSPRLRLMFADLVPWEPREC